MHDAYVQKDNEIYFPLQQTARPFDFPLRSYDNLSEDYQGGRDSHKAFQRPHFHSFHFPFISWKERNL
jgi:hypothetical protein